MTTPLSIQIESQEWFLNLIDDCKTIIVETEFTARWALIEGYHQLGKRILAENDNFERSKIYGQEICSRVSISLGKSRQTINRAIQFARIYPELNLLPEGKNTSWHQICNKYLPESKESKFIALPDGIYDVIYADPPWQYDNTGVDGAAEKHYQTLSIEELCQIKIPAADNSVLFMWVTNPFLRDAFTILDAWGFAYKTNIVWIKTNLVKPGAGFYVRGRHELLFICTKGSFTPDMKGKEPIGSVITADVRGHSQKPEQVYGLIEQLYPEGKYLELFAREKREHWVSWGNELETIA